MLSDATRGALVCFIGMLVAASAFLGAIKAASARDDFGALGFLSSVFGTHQADAAPVPTPPVSVSGQTQLNAAAKRHRSNFVAAIPNAKHPRRAAEPGNAHRVAKTGTLSIFQDKTLRRGDAVMTERGIRIFAGSNSWPYQNSDFMALADAPHLNKGQQTILLDLDRLPRR